MIPLFIFFVAGIRLRANGRAAALHTAPPRGQSEGASPFPTTAHNTADLVSIPLLILHTSTPTFPVPLPVGARAAERLHARSEAH